MNIRNREMKIHEIVGRVVCDKKPAIFLYQSGPIDFYQGWEKLNSANCNAAERLLIAGLTHFPSYLIDNYRGESAHFVLVADCDGPFEISPALVVCVKAQNDGIMNAFSTSPHIKKRIPHDFGYDWELVDASYLKEFNPMCDTSRDMTNDAMPRPKLPF